jgi:hypothetical protein
MNNYHKIWNYLAFKYFAFGRTWRRLFQKRVVHTKFDIYVFIIITVLIPLLLDYKSPMVSFAQ